MQVNANEVKRKPHDYAALRPFFAWKPWEVVRNTFKATTQYAKFHVRLPMRRHFKSRFPALNVRRIDETVATDTFFANTKAHDGSTCAQLYVGKHSLFTTCYGMKSDAEFPGSLLDFIRTFGAMNSLFSDNAKAQQSKAVQDILRLYHIKNA